MMIVVIVITIVLVAVRVLSFCPATFVPLGIRELRTKSRCCIFAFSPNGLESYWLTGCFLFADSQLAHDRFEQLEGPEKFINLFNDSWLHQSRLYKEARSGTYMWLVYD